VGADQLLFFPVFEHGQEISLGARHDPPVAHRKLDLWDHGRRGQTAPALAWGIWTFCLLAILVIAGTIARFIPPLFSSSQVQIYRSSTQIFSSPQKQ
jgi:hypothetical protein